MKTATVFDVTHFYWVVDAQGHLNVASAPSVRAPVCVSSGVEVEPGPPTPLTKRQAIILQQAAADMRQAPLTFLHSAEGVALIQRMLNGEHTLH